MTSLLLLLLVITAGTNASNVFAEGSIADTVSNAYHALTDNEKSAGQEAVAVAWDVAMGHWYKAYREAKELTQKLGKQNYDTEDSKLAAYGNYLKVKRALRDAFTQAMSSKSDSVKEELDDAKEKLHHSYNEATGSLDSAAEAAKIVIKKLIQVGSEYAHQAKDTAEYTKEKTGDAAQYAKHKVGDAVDYGEDMYEYAGEKKDDAISLLKRVANMAMDFVSGAKEGANRAEDSIKESVNYGAQKGMDKLHDFEDKAKNLYDHAPSIHNYKPNMAGEHHHYDYNDGHKHGRYSQSLLYKIDSSLYHLPCLLLTLGTLGCALFAYQVYERYEMNREQGVHKRHHLEPREHGPATNTRHLDDDDTIRYREKVTLKH